MSETIRDQALKAALSILDNNKKLAFISYRYIKQPDYLTAKNEYIAKVTPEQIKTILKQQELIALEKMVKVDQPVQKTIDDLLNTSEKIGLGAVGQEAKKQDKIYGVMLNTNGSPVIVQICSIYSYSQLAGIQTPLDSLKYLLSVIDVNQSNEAIALEHDLVNKITEKLQESFNVQYAQQLLGTDGYNEIVSMLDKPKDIV